MDSIAVIINAWAVICSFAWLLEANRNARKGKRTRPEIMTFAAKLETNLFLIQAGMQSGELMLGPYRKKWVYVPKKRLVMALPYPDRIVQWALYQYLEPIYDKTFIEDSYACRKGKGQLAAMKRLQYWMRQLDRKEVGGWYILKLDISKCFYRVDHERLIEILSRRIRDPCMMAFLRKIIDNRAEPFGLPRRARPDDTPVEEWLYETGMPIGNLTSQLFANIYLNELDQYCKHALRIHYYIRYMDDVIILGQKDDLLQWKVQIEKYLLDELRLDLNGKTAIRPLRMGVEFVGVKIRPTHMKLRKSTTGRLKREVRDMCKKKCDGKLSDEKFERRAASIRGLLEHTESETLRWRLNEIYRTVTGDEEYEPFAKQGKKQKTALAQSSGSAARKCNAGSANRHRTSCDQLAVNLRPTCDLPDNRRAAQ